MLNAFYGDMPEAIYNTSAYFDNTYQEEWLFTPFARDVIKDINRSEVISGEAISHPVYGIIPPTKLSGGVKTLILVANVPDKVFNFSTCGDNCAKWLLKLAEDRDVTVNLRHLMDFGRGKFKIKVLNTGKIVESMGELVYEAGEYV